MADNLRKSMLRTSCAVAILFAIAAPAGRAAGESVATQGTCSAAAQDERLRVIVASFDKVRAANPEVWNGYRPADAAYALLLRGSGDRWCAAIWEAGAVRMIELDGKPKFSTPMYGFHTAGGSGHWIQPPPVAAQLERLGVRRAVIVPLEPEIKLPFVLTALQIFDISVHEAVHLNVQAPVWMAIPGDHDWPAWTSAQPDRGDLSEQCYAPARAALERERAQLVDAAVTALANGDRTQICASARAFVETRQQRWTQLAAAAVSAPSANASDAPTMSCRQAEAVMEITEGAADFVAWISANEAGVVSLDQVKRRFMAQQRDVFYLTGAMQLVVLRHLVGVDRFSRLTREIATSASWRDAELTAALESALTTHCGAGQRPISTRR